MNLPNRLTAGRLVLTVVFVMALLFPADGVIRSRVPYAKTTALAVFIIASLTDWLDGAIARRRGLETGFGALLDPVADKILVAAAFICFIELRDYRGHALAQAWMVLVIVAREFLVTGIRLVALKHGVVLRAERLGKQKTIWQMTAVIVILTGLAAREDWNCFGAEAWFDMKFSQVAYVLMMIAVSLTLISGIAYLYKNRGLILRDA